MSRRSEGPHLWLRPERHDRAGNLTHRSTWIIVDGKSQFSTGLYSDATATEKEKAFNAYLTEKHKTTAAVGSRDPSQIPVIDVLGKYSTDKVVPYLESVAAPGRPGGVKWKLIEGAPNGPLETVLRIDALRIFWKGKTLSEVTGDNCRAYAKTRTAGAARRELEDLRAAINHHRREGLHDKIVSVILPPKTPPRERWLTRAEAAHLILTTWRYREHQNFRATERHTRRHVARFMVVARYMGSRASVICAASIEPKRPKGRAWVDLTTGLFYGRPEGQQATRKRKQLVRVPIPLLAHMRRWRAAGQRYVVEWHRAPVLRITKAHAAAVAKAGFEPDVTPHTWRHSLATWLIQDGANESDVADYLGMTVETLLRVYRHHRPDHSANVHKVLQRRNRAA